MSLVVQLERFEGPLGLLLHLIRKDEMDIFDINIHQITKQYLDYIKVMKKLDLEMAGDFVALAATLIQIKSRMLLPQYNEEGEEVISEDPRKELVQKLLEYQKYQEVSKRLNERPLLGRDVFVRGARQKFTDSQSDEIIMEDKPLFALISAYRSAIKAMKSGVHRVATELQSIAERILEMKDQLVIGRRVMMSDFITATENRSGQVLVTFLSVLELAKMGFISIFQSENYGEIHIDPKHAIDKDVVSRVEEFDSAQSDMVAAALTKDLPLAEGDWEDEAEAEDTSTESTSELSAEDLANPELIASVSEEVITSEMATDEDIAREEQELFAKDGEPDVTV